MSLEINRVVRCPYCNRPMALQWNFDESEIGTKVFDTQTCEGCHKPIVVVWRMTVQIKPRRVEGFYSTKPARRRRG